MKKKLKTVGVVAILFFLAVTAGCGRAPGGHAAAAGAAGPQANPAYSQAPPASTQANNDSLELSESDVARYKIKPVETRDFTDQRMAVGRIDFNEEMSTDVFPPVPGKILQLFARAGSDVAGPTQDKPGAPLYTIDSPDLVQAGSTLIAAAGVLDLTSRQLKRVKELRDAKGASERDVEQATSDQQAAEASLKAARDAVRIFGKTDKEMDAIVAQRRIDPELIVRSPITGRVTARNAAPGQLAQPGNPPAPYTVSDLSTMWMLADVAENDISILQLGLPVDVHVKAYPGRVFSGKVVNIGASVDPLTRRITVRSEIQDPKHELKAGMFATFVIRLGDTKSPAVPMAGVVREGDGTMSVWVAGSDRKTIVRRSVKVGMSREGLFQILEGLQPGELVATEAALFLSSALTMPK